MLHRALLLASLALLGLGAACTQSEDDACGKGNVYQDGVCRPAPVAASGKSGLDGGAPPSADGGASPAGAGGSSATPVETSAAFGDACEASSDCGSETNYCVPKSPFDTAYCSVSDCTPDDPSLCPDGWTCFDLSMFVPGEPWVCTRPFE